MSSMQITKIKFSGMKIEIVWSEEGHRATIDHSLSSFDVPHPDFVSAFTAFKPLVLDLLELDAAYGHDFRVTGVSVNYEEKDSRKGLVVTSQKKLAGTNAPLVLNTPHLREPTSDKDEGTGFYSGDLGDALTRLLGEAVRFIAGHRAQGNLFDKAA